MPLTDYTTTDEIRAALGVSTTELPDSILLQPQYLTLATIEMEEVNAGIPALYTTVSAIPEGTRTSVQQRFYSLSRLFVTYAIARNLLTSLPLFSVQRLTDGRAEFQRQADVFEDVRLGVNGMFNSLRLKLSIANKLLTPADSLYSTTAFSYTVSIGLGLDPVTNA